MIKLLTKEISDRYVRKNFELLQEFLDAQKILSTWEFFELEFDAAVTNYKKRHTLGTIPKDVIETSKTGAGTVTYNYTSFTSEYVDITTSGACKVRFFVGSVEA